MKGAKRAAVSDPATATATSGDFANKRFIGGSAFDVSRPQPSERQSSIMPTLDVHRAESSRQHVRALNTQFASWVQKQLKDHPDELWEDGVKDYLSHASKIMEKFSDVVNWLRANAMKERPAAESLSEKKLAPVLKNGDNRLFQEKPGVASASPNTSFTTSQSSSVLAKSPSSEGVFSASRNTDVLARPAAESLSEKKLAPELKNSDNGLFQEKPGIASASPNTSFTASWSSSVLSKSPISEGVFSASQNTNVLCGLFSNTQSSGLFSNSQSSGLSSNGQASGLFSTNQSSGAVSGSHSLAELSNGNSTVLFSNSQRSGLFSNSQSAGAFSNTPNSGVFSINQSSGAFSISQSLGGFSNAQTSSLFGLAGLSKVPTNRDTSNDVVDGEELQQPSSPSVKKSAEKGIVVVHEVKCRLYVKSSDPADKDAWKDKGMGHLSIKCKEDVSKGTKESKPTIIVRNDVGKVLLNALLYPGIKTNLQKNSIVAIFHTSDDSSNDGSVVARTFLLRTKTEEDRNKLATAIQEYAPAS